MALRFRVLLWICFKQSLAPSKRREYMLGVCKIQLLSNFHIFRVLNHNPFILQPWNWAQSCCDFCTDSPAQWTITGNLDRPPMKSESPGMIRNDTTINFSHAPFGSIINQRIKPSIGRLEFFRRSMICVSLSSSSILHIRFRDCKKDSSAAADAIPPAFVISLHSRCNCSRNLRCWSWQAIASAASLSNSFSLKKVASGIYRLSQIKHMHQALDFKFQMQSIWSLQNKQRYKTKTSHARFKFFKLLSSTIEGNNALAPSPRRQFWLKPKMKE